MARLDRDNDLDWEHADFGCDYNGQKYPLDQTHDDWDEYDPGQGSTDRY